MDNYIDLLKLILPEFLVNHFALLKHVERGAILHLYFEEHNHPPKEASSRVLIAHGFHKEITVEDFPLRGKSVYLHIKRRRWLDKTSKEIIQRDWNLVAQGTRMTDEFAAFLKALDRY